MKKNLYIIDRYLRCGAMPLYLIFYKSRQGIKGHYAMLCNLKTMRFLLRQKRGFSDPDQYGRIIYKSYDSEPGDALKYILKSRYDFDLEKLNGTESSLF